MIIGTLRAVARMTHRDAYANLLRDTRGMRRDHAGARERWYAQLPWEHKEESLFELEMLLKGFACFGNPRNHPGPPRRVPDVAHDFREELRIVRDALMQTSDQVRDLLGEKERAYVFSRYLETVLPEDRERTRLVHDQLAQDTPEAALMVLRSSFGGYLELADGLLRLNRIPHRLYGALQSTVTREIGRNAYFNPLVALEFRPEFDRIRAPEVLEALHAIESEATHRLVALTMLTLFRAIRYVSLVERYASQPATARRSYLILAVLRSDVRALTRFLFRQAAGIMADGLERELMEAGASDIKANQDLWARRAATLLSLRRTLENIANALRIEIRKTFERELPTPSEAPADELLGPLLTQASASLKATLHSAVLDLCVELAPERALPELHSDGAGRRAASVRLRRDVWMFKQILRAFLAKADAAASGELDHWSSAASFVFVREFLNHFRAIGYQLVRRSDYERLDHFIAAIDTLRDADLLDEQRMHDAVDECRAFYAYLERLLAQISRREELRDLPFDKQTAADTLRVYLGAA